MGANSASFFSEFTLYSGGLCVVRPPILRSSAVESSSAFALITEVSTSPLFEQRLNIQHVRRLQVSGNSGQPKQGTTDTATSYSRCHRAQFCSATFWHTAKQRA